MGTGNRNNFLLILTAMAFCWLGGIAATPASAHGVVVFAWVEGDTVHVESKFSGGRKVKAGRISVLDAEGHELLEGTTDSEGNFNFPLPGNEAIKIVLEAGMGHRGQWTLSAADIKAARGTGSQAPARQSTLSGTESAPREAPSAVAPRPDQAGIDQSAVEAAVERALDRKLAPVLRMLADSRQRGPTLKDVIGGIGYILGLIGLAAYVHSRKKS